jgi:hypothetical protein
MDGTVEIRFIQPEQAPVPDGTEGSIGLAGEPAGHRMGYVKASRGHMTLLPAQVAYQFHSDAPGVILLQTIKGADTIERWGEICQQL